MNSLIHISIIQDLCIFDTSTIYFFCKPCDKKVFVDCKDWDENEVKEKAKILEISLDEVSDEEMDEDTKEATLDENVLTFKNKDPSEENIDQEKTVPNGNISKNSLTSEKSLKMKMLSKIDTKKKWSHTSRCQVMFTGYNCINHMKTVVKLGKFIRKYKGILASTFSCMG